MKRKKILFVLLTALSLCCFLTRVVTYAASEVSVINNFSTGIVDIRLEEYQITDGKEIRWEDNPIVMPGDQISKIPRITADGNDCYVRVEIIIRNTDDIHENDIYGISDHWIKAKDGYYYYDKILKTGESVDFFQGVNIPVDLSQELEGTLFYIDINVEAVQSENFFVDYDADFPWGDIDIELCEKEGFYDIKSSSQTNQVEFSISYEGDSKKLFLNNNDFFQNFSELMPGGSYSDLAEIKNNSNHAVKLYFKTETIDESVLLDKLILKITYKDDFNSKVVYEGKLEAKEISTGILLTEINPNETGRFAFEIQVPAEWNNAYELLSSKVKWIFSTEEIQSELEHTEAGNTGDSINIGTCLMLIGVALLVLVCILYCRKSDR